MEFSSLFRVAIQSQIGNRVYIYPIHTFGPKSIGFSTWLLIFNRCDKIVKLVFSLSSDFVYNTAHLLDQKMREDNSICRLVARRLGYNLYPKLIKIPVLISPLI